MDLSARHLGVETRLVVVGEDVQLALPLNTQRSPHVNRAHLT